MYGKAMQLSHRAVSQHVAEMRVTVLTTEDGVTRGEA